MNDEEFELLKTLLASLSGMDLLSLHSYLRLEHRPKKIRLAEIIESDILNEDFEISAAQLLAYIEIEFQHRNLN